MNFLEKLYKDPELINESHKKEINLNLRKLFVLSFARVYLKIFVDWIDKNNFTKTNEIKGIIDIINEEEYNIFRNMPDIRILFEENILDSYRHFDSIQKEKNIKEAAKYIVFVEAYKQKNEDLIIFTVEFNLLNKLDDNVNELKQLIENKNRLDIFYSAFSAKISSHLSNPGENKDAITVSSEFNLLSNSIHTIFDRKEKLKNKFIFR